MPALLSSEATSDKESNPDEVGLFVGPWGPYVQKLSSRAANDGATSKPPSAPLPASMAADLSAITPQALETLLSTRETGGILLGQHPDDGRSIRLKVGRFGPYLQWGDDDDDELSTTHSLPKDFGSNRTRESSTDELDEFPMQRRLILVMRKDYFLGSRGRRLLGTQPAKDAWNV